MRRTSLSILILLLFAGAVLAQEHKERERPPQTATPSSGQSGQGLRYTSPEGRYSALLPEQPRLSTQQITTPDGTPLTQYMAMAGKGTPMFMVAYFDYPPGIDFFIDKARDGMVAAIKGTLLDERSISLGGAPGREIKIAATTEEGIQFIDRARFYDVRPRVFVLQCIFPKSMDNPEMFDKCDQFFDSFSVRRTP